jgi:TonB-linked SusC/RagA family outer membrane protein|tara:strand:+ start:106 stop:3156 length:3051 start_codon:yes stop_codon:yes gene_type:complete
MKKNLLLLMFLACNSLLWSQERVVTGNVTDEDGIPLPGVSIIIEGTTSGTATDFDGNYSVNVEQGKKLVFSYVGMVTQKQVVGTSATLDVTLATDASQLDEVIVVGYGTQSKRDLTGSIATVKGDAITERSTANISTALQGAVAGLTVTRTSSAPGSGSTLRIRGNTTLQGSNNPLILVDDVAVRSIDVVPADQVESVTVLKDAAAAAIYGSRGAAGVIIITTKRAKNGVFRASYSGEYFITTPAENREFVGPARYQEIINERLWNDSGNGENQFPLYTEEQINAYKAGEHLTDRDAYPYTDWNEVLLKKNTTGTRHSVNISGGTEKVRSNFSLSYENQDALYINRDWTRYTARFNNDIKMSDKFGALADITFRLVEDENPTIDPTRNTRDAPVFNSHHQDGSLAGGRGGGNPYARLISGSFSNTKYYDFGARLGVYFKPIDDLKISLNFSPNFNFNENKTWIKPIPYWGADDPDHLQEPNYASAQEPSLKENRDNTNTLTKQAYINYTKVFGDHNLDVLLGYEDNAIKTENLRVRADQYISADFPYLSQAPADRVFDNGTSVNELAYISYFGRANYNYKGKYYVSASVRKDGSSRFGRDYRWGTFPSVSAAWTVTNEDFMNSLKRLSFLRLKGSYGSIGNDRLGNYLYLTVLEVSDVLIDQGGSAELVRGLAQKFLTTPDIQWETTTSQNIGIEAGLFDSRLSLEAEFYIKDTEDMLLSLSVPDLVGFNDPTVNVGSMQTKGWAVSTSWNDTVGENFSYGASFNIFNDESIIGDINDKQLFSGNTLSEEGSEFRELYGLVSDGLYQTEEELIDSPTTSGSVTVGDVRYKDLSGPEGEPDGVINNFDRKFLGSSLDHYNYGGQLHMGYKGFDFGLNFQGVAKKNFIFTRNIILSNPEVDNQSVEFEGNYWSMFNTPEENLNVAYPRMSLTSNSNNYRFSDYWIRDGAYLKIKSITLGYSIPSDVIAKTAFSKIRLYVTGTDLFTFDNLPDGVDPEQISAGSYYLTKSAVFGLQLNF